MVLSAVHGSKSSLQAAERHSVVQQGLPEQLLRLKRRTVRPHAGAVVAVAGCVAAGEQ